MISRLLLSLALAALAACGPSREDQLEATRASLEHIERWLPAEDLAWVEAEEGARLRVRLRVEDSLPFLVDCGAGPRSYAVVRRGERLQVPGEPVVAQLGDTVELTLAPLGEEGCRFDLDPQPEAPANARREPCEFGVKLPEALQGHFRVRATYCSLQQLGRHRRAILEAITPGEPSLPEAWGGPLALRIADSEGALVHPLDGPRVLGLGDGLLVEVPEDGVLAQ
ncbi:MAG TPA: hypothetical protein RMH85_02180 [Polyangiaceae bacterium LLY-WYZ-15_(1-7)]|nr:hypothetical protein [Sandaracinus sp.]HJL00960.1 hypothetical protein [Polyangiaceae bacterium LLY-WYZ-15_(1-7)]MBJ74725.1 hypothetical protein [Sandaracinus sp.]HJL07274.1 hypothetical protein [Polyangiaceae bacterium LLY-WYZ-15_(1-7)]HJL25132.1 hypothetical protein [Polyangiaceae bacterium LLY-WYZ-15_(1-7)]